MIWLNVLEDRQITEAENLSRHYLLFYSYNWFKKCNDCNGRWTKKVKVLSHEAFNPSESTENINIAALLDAIKTMDYTKYPGGAVIYMDIPLMYKTPQPSLFCKCDAGSL